MLLFLLSRIDVCTTSGSLVLFKVLLFLGSVIPVMLTHIQVLGGQVLFRQLFLSIISNSAKDGFVGGNGKYNLKCVKYEDKNIFRAEFTCIVSVRPGYSAVIPKARYMLMMLRSYFNPEINHLNVINGGVIRLQTWMSARALRVPTVALVRMKLPDSPVNVLLATMV